MRQWFQNTGPATHLLPVVCPVQHHVPNLINFLLHALQWRHQKEVTNIFLSVVLLDNLLLPILHKHINKIK